MWTAPALTPHTATCRADETAFKEYGNRRTFVVRKTYIICGDNPATVPSDTG
jgi:hypothetical protein